jgi:concanavalin A-like lectin/glucanase superfamily protein
VTTHARIARSLSDFVPSGGGGGGYASEVLADSPLAYWRQGEAGVALGTTMADASGNGHDGLYTASITLGATGLVTGDTDTAADYQGGHATVGYDSWMDTGPTFAVDCIIKPSSVAGNFNFIVNAADGGVRGPWWLILDGGKLELGIGTAPFGFQQVTGSTTIVAGTTYHVGAIYDGVDARVYVNGVQDASASRTGAMSTTSSDLWIGNWASAGLPFAGVIDEVAIYASLTPTRLAAHAAAI